ncbi:MAG: rod shape-determining protein RodA [Actinobacteria bacterium]|nr:rod shape-determining protein RodA [Actinomycetota bacterium]
MTTLTGEPHGVRARPRQAVAGLDWWLLGMTLAVSGFGAFVVRAATESDVASNSGFYFTRQLAFTVVGLVCLFFVLRLNLEDLSRYVWTIYAILVASVGAVLVLGASARGSTRWIDLGPVRLQPSELGKVVIAFVLAVVLVERLKAIEPARLSLMVLGLTMLPAVIVFLQPDLGTALVYVAIAVVMLWVAGQPITHFIVAGAVIVAVAGMILYVLPAAGLNVLQPYQVDRLTSFVDSGGDRTQSGYQLEQSKVAIGSGGAFGKGPSGATQTINDFLPEHHTDFIFAVVAEMFGFLGGGLLIAAYFIIIWRAIVIMRLAPTELERLVAAGIAAMLAFEVFVNIGMNVGIMPITGIPLPFMSYGGSHTLTNLVAVGVLLRIGMRGRAAQAAGAA